MSIIITMFVIIPFLTSYIPLSIIIIIILFVPTKFVIFHDPKKWDHFGKLSIFSENSTNFTILKLLF
jgi:hypothetical protein